MRALLYIGGISLLLFGVAFAKDALAPTRASKSISVSEYEPNSPHSPAAFSSVSAKGLNAAQKRGQKIYAKWCLACHGEGMPATAALEVLYQGEVNALLEQREDLSFELVQNFVRYGKHSMPFFRKAEISDSELKDLAAYLGRKTK